MNTIATAANLLAAEGHVVNELIAPDWVFGVGCFIILLLMLAATMSLRSVSLRHPEPSEDVEVHGTTGRGTHPTGH